MGGFSSHPFWKQTRGDFGVGCRITIRKHHYFAFENRQSPAIHVPSLGENSTMTLKGLSALVAQLNPGEWTLNYFNRSFSQREDE
jgi:hypothetical protein